jgi:hypothetical protein
MHPDFSVAKLEKSAQITRVNTVCDIRITNMNTVITYSKTLPTLNKVIIKCTVHYTVHLQCTFSLYCTYESMGFCGFGMGTGTKEDD